MEEIKVVQNPFNEDKTKEERFSSAWSLFKKYEEIRNQNVRFLSKGGIQRNIIDYVRDGVDRMNEYHLKPSHKEAWQNNVFDPITRNKLISLLSIIAGSRMKPEVIVKSLSIFNTKDSNVRKSIFSDLLDAANRKNNDEENLIWEMYTAMSEGTVFGYESWIKDAREVEYVKEYNPDTGEKTTEKIKIDAWDDVYGEIVPIEEFYPETIWTSDFKKIGRAFRVSELSLNQFVDKYSKFSGAKDVHPAGFYTSQEGFEWGISADINVENVQVVQFFDAKADKLGIWANGVELYYGCMPWNHKRLPFWRAIFEPVHHQFLYGKSLPDKLMGMQDIDNAMFNGMLDQTFLALNTPVFIDGEADADDGYLEPGRLYSLTPGTNVTRVPMGGIDGNTLSMFSNVKRSLEESSISAQASGVPTGGRKTKYEVQQLQEGALSLASLFLQLMESAVSQKYLLRMYNIIQYYSMPSNVGKDKKKFKFIRAENRKLTNGKTGTRLVQIVGSQNEMPTKDNLREVSELESGKPFDILESRVEPIVVTRDWLMGGDFDLEIRIVPNSSVKETEADRKNKSIAFYQATRQDPMFDQEINARDFAEAFDKPVDIVKVQQNAAMPVPGQVLDQAGLPGMPGMRGMGAQPDMNLL